MKVYYAKSSSITGKAITVKDHLSAVCLQAKKYGKEIGLESEGGIAGLLHDVGKYSERFEGVLNGTRHHIDHAFSSASILYAIIHNSPQKHSTAYHAIITAINGHHDGLIDCGMIKEKMACSLSSQEDLETPSGKYASLNGRDYSVAFRALTNDLPEWKHELGRLPELKLDALASMLRTRMLFSCLVDADYTMSAMDENNLYITQTESSTFDAAGALHSLYRHCDEIRRTSKADPALNQLRDEVFEQCGAMGDTDEGLYTLTSPTGTGKTLAMLHFALRHCLYTGKSRIIVVLPFLTLTEQNARTYEAIVGKVLEDHSQSHYTDETKEYSSRWRVPFIITTSVKFFESLFASQPGDCRKLHNIANSIILFDEAQSLPNELLNATLDAVKELCTRYHCSMLFSTATQPAFQTLTAWNPVEILPNHPEFFSKLKRTRVEWRLDSRVPLAKIAEEMLQYTNVCAIVNLRAHARTLFNEVRKARQSSDGLYFLTTDLCPAHRKAVVEEIKARQKAGLPCLMVATQCIEAGIDLDFDVLYRSLAPLESIIQAAGRCNRNGKAAAGRVVVFEPDEERLYPSHDYEKAANIVKRLHDKNPIDIHNPQDIQQYYVKLFEHHKDKTALWEAIHAADYQEAAKAYKLINTQAYKVIAPYAGQKVLFDEIREAVQSGLTPDILQKAAPITVGVFQNNLQALTNIAEPLYYPQRNYGFKQESDTFIIRAQYVDCYDSLVGLMLDEASQTKASDFFMY